MPDPYDGLVHVVINDSGDDPALTDPNYPIIVSIAEWESIFKRYRPPCEHEWEYRIGRPVGQFKIVHLHHIEECALPSGRICRKCGKIDPKWEASPNATERWKQKDFTP
jgi:hypothetical protein